MKKTLLFLTVIALCGCGNKTQKSSENTVEKPIDTTVATAQADEPQTAKKMKYLYFSAGDAIGFFDDGTVAEYMSCGENAENWKTLFTRKVVATYKEFPTYLLTDKKIGKYGTKFEFYSKYYYGNVESEWAMMNFQDIYYQPSSITHYVLHTVSEDNIQDIRGTCLIQMPVEIKHFENEDSPEAEEYLTIMDDYAWFMSETIGYFEQKGVKNISPKKKYLRFTLSDGERIVIDSDAAQNNVKPAALLYRKGAMPVVIDIATKDEDFDIFTDSYLQIGEYSYKQGTDSKRLNQMLYEK
ncbi:MAG: hypothetical protein LBN95_03600 [Prevotellaceae bacterium]|jgi:hypothetical protein|nr:hypothetical protein [Prevotellaceae bacterium]